MPKLTSLITAGFLFALATPSLGQSFSTEEKFQDIFITAGYATAFGAAVGAASLSFFEDPADHLQNVAIGASLGFLGGSVLGTYIVFSPSMVQNDQMPTELLARNKGLTIRPIYSRQQAKMTALAGSMTLLDF